MVDSEYWHCPNSDRILWASPTDNKARCGCGKTNPNLPNASTNEVFYGHLTMHFKFALKPATEAEYKAHRDKVLK